MKSRRKFLTDSALTLTALTAGIPVLGSTRKGSTDNAERNLPIVISTWNHGMEANAGAWKILGSKGKALDAVEAGVMVTEADPNSLSVGLSGHPDRDGIVTLDACIMDELGRCGSVAALQRIKHPISVARMVMEKTPHVMLVSEGAQKFALDNGFKLESQKLSAGAEKAYKEWLLKNEYKPVINIENHDTIGMVALDVHGNLSGSCTTSGLSYKLHGRVGDSPIIGAGLYVDNEVGAACATGLGEAVIKVCGSFLVVELMRQGFSPEQACRMAIDRLISKNPGFKDLQVGFLALNKNGEFGGWAIQKGFNFAVRDSNQNKMVNAKSFL